MAELIDRMEDVLVELVAEQGLEISPGMERVVVALACGLRSGSANAERLREAFGVGPVVAGDLHELASKIMKRIDGDSRPGLEAACVDFAFGLGLNGGKSQTAIAAEHGVGRACVSARVVSICEDFERYPEDGSAPARGMKSNVARGKYRQRELSKERPVKEVWAFKGLLGRVFGSAGVSTMMEVGCGA